MPASNQAKADCEVYILLASLPTVVQVLHEPDYRHGNDIR